MTKVLVVVVCMLPMTMPAIAVQYAAVVEYRRHVSYTFAKKSPEIDAVAAPLDTKDMANDEAPFCVTVFWTE
jgi:hypothetical protein